MYLQTKRLCCDGKSSRKIFRRSTDIVLCYHGERSRTQSTGDLQTVVFCHGQISETQSTEDLQTNWSTGKAREVDYTLLNVYRISGLLSWP